MNDPFKEGGFQLTGRHSERFRKFSLIAALVIGGVALIGAGLWFNSTALALTAFLIPGVVIVPCCIQIGKET